MLDERKIKVALLKAQGVGITKIAQDLGISRQTVYNWLEEDEVKAEMDRHGQEFLSQTIHMLSSEGPKSIQRLIYLRDNAESEKVQLDAASKIVDKLVSNATKIDINSTENNANTLNNDILEQEFSEVDDD